MERLTASPQDFSLEQALRLLALAREWQGDSGREFIRRNVRLRTWLSLAFPSIEVSELIETSPESPASVDSSGKVPSSDQLPHYLITGTNFGLYSTLGPLPTFYTEELFEEFRKDESITRDFLDIINNHLYHIYHRARTHHLHTRRTLEEHDLSAALLQFSLMGQAYPDLRDNRENQQQHPPFVTVMELLVSRARSAPGLEDYLRRILDLDRIEVEECVRRTVRIPLHQRCRVGMENCRIGEEAILGEQIKDDVGKFRLHLYDLTEERIRSFFPGRPAHKELVRHLRRYLETPLEYDLVLHPSALPSSPHRLGENMEIGCFLTNQQRGATYMPVCLYGADFT